MAHSRFHFDVDFLIKDEFYDDEESIVVKNNQQVKIYDYIADWSEGIDMTWLPHRDHSLKFGAFHKDIDFDLGAGLNELSLLDSTNRSREWGFLS
ncbi:MAG: hypothetical protein U5N26_02955 [Candidatus Marinimicrobia bacterium]|nr:hypothetical protein [Candidatus Neomarinimicrobiota bacterium]